MNDEEFGKYFEKLVVLFNINSLGDSYKKVREKTAKDCVKQILEEIESNAIKKAPRHELQVELFEIDEPF
jgi:hypothetical protein